MSEIFLVLFGAILGVGTSLLTTIVNERATRRRRFRTGVRQVRTRINHSGEDDALKILTESRILLLDLCSDVRDDIPRCHRACFDAHADELSKLIDHSEGYLPFTLPGAHVVVQSDESRKFNLEQLVKVKPEALRRLDALIACAQRLPF